MSEYRTGYLRRGIGIFILVIPFALAVASIIIRPLSSCPNIAVGIGCLAIMISILNFWLSFLRPLFWERKYGGMKGYRFVSGIPVIGTILAVVAVLVGFGHLTPAIIALIVLLIDTAGSLWFVVWTWKDRSFWDIENPTTTNKHMESNG